MSIATLDRRTGLSETNISLSGFWSYDQKREESISNIPWHPQIKELVLEILHPLLLLFLTTFLGTSDVTRPPPGVLRV